MMVALLEARKFRRVARRQHKEDGGTIQHLLKVSWYALCHSLLQNSGHEISLNKKSMEQH
jgi:hypothetical protein